MKTKQTMVLLASLALAASMSVVSADQTASGPMQLSLVQMDDVTAAGGKKGKKRPPRRHRGSNKAKAGASALAFGRNTRTSTYTNATAGPGFSLSYSGSRACSGSCGGPR